MASKSKLSQGEKAQLMGSALLYSFGILTGLAAFRIALTFTIAKQLAFTAILYSLLISLVYYLFWKFWLSKTDSFN